MSHRSDKIEKRYEWYVLEKKRLTALKFFTLRQNTFISLILFTHRINSVECVKMLNEPMTPT